MSPEVRRAAQAVTLGALVGFVIALLSGRRG
jgi:hypothetical protein